MHIELPYHRPCQEFIRDDLSYEEVPVEILDRKEQVLRNRTISWVKVLWKNHSAKEASCEREDDMLSRYPSLFQDQGKKNFKDKIFIRREDCNVLVSFKKKCKIKFFGFPCAPPNPTTHHSFSLIPLLFDQLTLPFLSFFVFSHTLFSTLISSHRYYHHHHHFHHRFPARSPENSCEPISTFTSFF